MTSHHPMSTRATTTVITRGHSMAKSLHSMPDYHYIPPLLSSGASQRWLLATRRLPSPHHASRVITFAGAHGTSSSSSSSSSSFSSSTSGDAGALRGERLLQDQDDDDDEWYLAQAEDEEWFRREQALLEARTANQEAPRAGEPQVPDYLALPEASLFAQCRMDTFRASGPGGQHRNKTDSGVRVTHLPTGLVAQAVEDRSQHKNRATAMSRLRLLIAAKVRRPLKLRGYIPPPELVRLLPAESGKKSSSNAIGSNHPDYAKGVQALLDLLAASEGYVFYAAGLLRVSTGALSKVLTADKIIMQATNELLVSKGQKAFK